MRQDVRTLTPPLASSGSSNVVRIDDLESPAVFIGTSDGVAPVGVTVKVQGKASFGSFIMSEWIDIASIANAAIVLGSRTDIPSGYTMVRLTMTGYTSGNLVSAVSGKNSRTDRG